jgi:Fis family transcriptional regulator
MIIGAAVRKIDAQQIESQPIDKQQGRLTVLQANRTEPLRECVRSALRFYLKCLDGYEVTDLHEMVMREVELPLIETLLDHTRGNQTQAARLLGMSRSTLRKKMAHYGLRPDA